MGFEGNAARKLQPVPPPEEEPIDLTHEAKLEPPELRDMTREAMPVSPEKEQVVKDINATVDGLLNQLLPDLMRRLKQEGTLAALDKAGGELSADDGLSPVAQELMKRLHERIADTARGESLDQLSGT